MRPSLTHSKSATILATIALILATLATARATERTVFTFNGNNGNTPYQSLIMDAAGNIYGITGNGGANNLCFGFGCGVVFKLTQNSSGVWQQTVLHRFIAGFDGDIPNSLIMDAAGNLYGTTYYGGGRGSQNCNGRAGCGVIFKLSPTASGPWTETILYRCAGGDCAQPKSLAFDSAGNLYGAAAGGGGSPICANSVTLAGCGVVFQLSPTASGLWTLTPLHTFLNTPTDAQGPIGLTFGPGGVIYGVTGGGGPGGGLGSVYQLSPSSSGWNITYLHSFGIGQDGSFPATPLMMDASGNLFGTTPEGGTGQAGIAWELSPGPGGTWTETVLHNFSTGVDGIQPEAGLTFDSAGNLYGTTFYGGGTTSQCQVGCGVIFKLTPSGSGAWTEKVVFRFTAASGYRPEGPLLPDGLGNFYGTLIFGGATNDGRVFKYTP